MDLTPSGHSSCVLLDGDDISNLLRGVTVISSVFGGTTVELHPAHGRRAHLVARLPEARVVITQEEQSMTLELPDVELVSAAAHEAWMDAKRAQGITNRKAEDGEELMVPYADLSEKAKDLDRSAVRAVYRAIEAAAALK